MNRALDPCDPSLYPPASLAESPGALNLHQEWFWDPSRRPEDNIGPWVIVVDHFYDDPHGIRELGLQMMFRPYSPPSADLVGPDMAARYAGERGLWASSAVVAYLGHKVRNPFIGERYNPSFLADRLAAVVSETVDRDTWKFGGDYWNGAFHLIDGEWIAGRGSIHHHFQPRDVEPRGWSGVVYLSPDAPPSSGTSIWREKATGLCVAAFGPKFDANVSNFELALLLENRFNRLVLFRENVLHRAEHGFGQGKQARLTQTFFFRTTRASQT